MPPPDVATTFLPPALAIIMLGLGLSLRVSDFTRTVRNTRAVMIGLSCQMLLMPVVCFFIAHAFSLSPEMAVGLMLLSASPGGAAANLYSHLANGDVALNITLTALNSFLALFSMPLIVGFSLQSFMGEGQYVPLQFNKVLEVFLLVLIPVTLGMWMNHRFPRAAQRLAKPVKILSVVFLVAVIMTVTYQNRARFWDSIRHAGGAALTFNLASLLLGYSIPRLANLDKPQSIAIGMEVGIHNGTLAIYLALNVLGNFSMSIPPAIYSLLMFFTAGVFGWLVNMKPIPSRR